MGIEDAEKHPRAELSDPGARGEQEPTPDSLEAYATETPEATIARLREKNHALAGERDHWKSKSCHAEWMYDYFNGLAHERVKQWRGRTGLSNMSTADAAAVVVLLDERDAAVEKADSLSKRYEQIRDHLRRRHGCDNFGTPQATESGR